MQRRVIVIRRTSKHISHHTIYLFYAMSYLKTTERNYIIDTEIIIRH